VSDSPRSPESTRPSEDELDDAVCRRTLDRMLEGCQIIGRDYRYLYVNDAVVRHGRQPREALIGRTMMEAYPGIEQTEIFRAIGRVMDGGAAEMVTNEFRFPDGEVGWFELSVQPIPEGAFILSIDITERVRTQRISNRSQRLESLGTLASGVAHDLNNALAPVLLTAEMMRLEPGADVESLDIIEDSARRAVDLIRQLLVFARGGDGQRVPVSIAEVIEGLERMMRSTFPKRIDVHVAVADGLPPLQGDPTQVHQVLLNLCVNARDAMPDGGELRVEAGVMDVDQTYASSVVDGRAGRFITVAVRDTGTGIPAEVLDRIFEPFFTTKDADRGTGLGLSTSLGIVRSHLGFVHVYSEVGSGTTFRVFLPVADDAASPPLPAEAVGLEGDGRGVLVVDDDPRVRQAAQTALASLGFAVHTASDGADALMRVAEHHGHLHAIILDLQMPRMDGAMFYARLREVLPDIPVVIASGHLHAIERVPGSERAPRLAKPFTQVDLVRALREALGGAGQTSSA
jgi:PAS domain S-box-containing protein